MERRPDHGPRRPVSTYRFQVSADLDLFEVARRLEYVHDLGIDWVYLSPLLAAEPGSTHGYDVVAHDHLDVSRGGEEGLDAVRAEARRLGLGVLVDIVPNHVGVATPSEDPWWWEVLRDGRDAEHAAAFDIDWDTADQRLRIPVVGDDDLLPDGGVDHLRLVEGERGLELHYWDQAFPVAHGTADGVDDDPQAVHARQHYELVDWHRADDALNYRRFFAVNTLAAVRVEEPEVFDDTHVEIRRWFTEDLVDGLRVDHPDGLRDPKGYLDDLARLTGGAYTLVEKILEPGEALPTSWATDGTTGYDALAWIDRVLTDPAGQAPLDALEARLRGLPAGERVDYPEMVHDLKREVADGILHSEVLRIVRDLRRDVPERVPSRTADAVAELMACFPVYRSYLPEGSEHVDQAFAAARSRRPDLAATLDTIEPWLRDPSLDACRRFQQTSGMVMAKGVEDCAFYRYSRLTSLNEVGGDPHEFALGVDGLHEHLAARQRDWPHAMTTLSTHDTKRGEDVRARITTLAEVPHRWERALDQLLELVPLPDPGFASLLWQAVLGAWPALPDDAAVETWRERLHGYAEKAMREAGDHTTWTEPDETYEAAVHAAVDAVIDDAGVRSVLTGLLADVVDAGWSNALATKLLALTMPGVPDVYQGSELWEQSLVDPDNRRPVDLDLRARLLAGSDDHPVAPSGVDDPGAAKLHVTAAALRLRRDRPELFTGYAPVSATGEAAEHVVAFDRGGALTVATRLPVGLADRGGWGDTRLDLPTGRWRDTLTGDVTDGDLTTLLATYPVALLVKEDD
ncbi:Maltooligosyl trehalose synthase [Nocardioides dokdonensis FR1436]|uniref:Maltooligosyl trehalose synthase n=1 Tax=Nocardioides dokdonensis FR1436 TaxID=1300347 RepID=A0A1A9GHY0_9ACTN|nr:malto-oligosyltrehalose synthase [Nocardioides dokdonensis]ANH37917.1 Maltooligosyl trehalose synthase [Nocardioides dokdonensis FR1436]